MELLMNVFNEQAERTAWLEKKYPWFDIIWNWTIAICIAVLLVAMIVFGIQNEISRKAEDKAATAMAAYQAEQQAAADLEAERLAAIQASEEFIMSREATQMAKAIYGIRLFIEKYSYTELDLLTYCRCMLNRADASGNSLEAVIAQEGQFLGFSDGNPVLDDYYSVAMKAVQQWHSETTKPVDSSYQFAELNSDGIWLKNDINANGYARRWRAA